MNEMQRKCLHVSVAGHTNVGKSTLINLLVGAKISIVTPKPQTTRSNLRGIINHQNAQIILMDTPGIFVPRKNIDSKLLDSAFCGVREGEIIMIIIDHRPDSLDDKLIEALIAFNKRAILVINKIDLIRNKANLLDISGKANNVFSFEKTFMISAKNGDGVQDLQQYLVDIAPESDWFYPEDQLTDVSMRFAAEEITREKLFFKLDQELPYNLFIKTDKWQETDSDVFIYQTIYVTRQNYKNIVIGKKGSMIKSVGEDARRELSKIIDNKSIHLFLHVKMQRSEQEEL